MPTDSNTILKDLFLNLVRDIVYTQTQNIPNTIDNLTKIYSTYHMPYIALRNEINYMEKELIRVIVNDKNSNEVLDLLKLFDSIEAMVAKSFLNNYLVILKEQNNLRLEKLDGTLEDKMMGYYNAHIKWVNDLADAMLFGDLSKIPQMDYHKCNFGKWLDSGEAQKAINNTESYLELYSIHKQLHTIAQKVSMILTNQAEDYHDCLVYTQKAETISKDIGSKLSFFSNKLMIQKAIKDPLTGALNRSLMSDLFTKEYGLHAAIDGTFVLAMCDLDHFKVVNDTYGHLAGDEVLKFFASLLKETFRESDIIIRYGGEEFVIILPSSKISSSLGVFEKLRKSLQMSEIVYDGHKISMTVSIGVVEIYPDIDNTEDTLEYYLNKADSLLYEAKENGRNRIEQ